MNEKEGGNVYIKARGARINKIIITIYFELIKKRQRINDYSQYQDEFCKMKHMLNDKILSLYQKRLSEK